MLASTKEGEVEARTLLNDFRTTGYANTRLQWKLKKTWTYREKIGIRGYLQLNNIYNNRHLKVLTCKEDVCGRKYELDYQIYCGPETGVSKFVVKE